MCNKKIYKRLKKLHDYITDDKCLYTKEFDGIAYKYKTFGTKLGARNVIASMIDKSVVIGYHDYDDSLLFYIVCDTRGKITILQSKVDEVGIFSAIYELECLIWENKKRKRSETLEKLLSYYSPNVPSGFCYFPYGYWSCDK